MGSSLQLIIIMDPSSRSLCCSQVLFACTTDGKCDYTVACLQISKLHKAYERSKVWRPYRQISSLAKIDRWSACCRTCSLPKLQSRQARSSSGNGASSLPRHALAALTRSTNTINRRDQRWADGEDCLARPRTGLYINVMKQVTATFP